MNLSFKLIALLPVVLTFLGQFLVISARETQAEILKGVTIRNWPYADRLSGKFEGFVVDLMNEIAETVGFDYRLYFSPDGKYGGVADGRVNGMIGEIYNNRADFAVADITITDIRKKYVEFTEPFIENGIAILIHKDNAKNIRSFRDLADQTDIKYGTYRMSATANLFAQSNDPVIRRMHLEMTRNPDVFVSNAKEGVDRVNTTRYAFLVESTFAEFLSGIYCNLTYIEDSTNYFPRQYAIAMPKDSIYTQKFSSAIRKLKSNGQLNKIKARYWRDRCVENTTTNNLKKTLGLSPNGSYEYINQEMRPTIKWADKGYDVSKAPQFLQSYVKYVFVFIVFKLFTKNFI